MNVGMDLISTQRDSGVAQTDGGLSPCTPSPVSPGTCLVFMTPPPESPPPTLRQFKISILLFYSNMVIHTSCPNCFQPPSPREVKNTLNGVHKPITAPQYRPPNTRQLRYTLMHNRCLMHVCGIEDGFLPLQKHVVTWKIIYSRSCREGRLLGMIHELKECERRRGDGGGGTRERTRERGCRRGEKHPVEA